MHIIGITGQAGAGKDEVASRFVKQHGYTQLSLADPLKRFAFHVFGFDAIQLWGPSSARNTFDPTFNECNIRSQGIEFKPGCKMSTVRRACDPGWADAASRLATYGPEWVAGLVEADKQDDALEILYFWFASLGHHYPQLSPRIMLQNLGTEWGRQEISPDIWIDELISTATRVLQGYGYSREEGVSNKKTKVIPRGVVVSDVRFKNELDAIHAAGGKLIRVCRAAADKKAKKLGIAGHASEAEQATFSNELFDAVVQNEGSLPDLYKNIDVVALALGGGSQ